LPAALLISSYVSLMTISMCEPSLGLIETISEQPNR